MGMTNIGRRGVGRRYRVIVALAGTALLAACGDTPGNVATAGPQSAAPETTAPSTTSGEPPAWVVDDLPECGDESSYTTVASWLPTDLPDPYRMASAGTSVHRDAPTPASTQWLILLVARTPQNGVASTIRLATGESPPWTTPSEPIPGTPMLHTVRGNPGQIAEFDTTTRSGVSSARTARWREDGEEWTAVAATDTHSNEQLAAVLDRLELGAEVVDPAGEFEVMWQQRGTPATHEQRYTRISLEADGEHPQLIIDLQPLGESEEGLHLAQPDRSVVLRSLDGRVVASNGHEITTTLADGTPVRIMAFDPTTQQQARPTETQLPQEWVDRLVRGIEATSPTDPALDGVALDASWQQPGDPGYCREA